MELWRLTPRPEMLFPFDEQEQEKKECILFPIFFHVPLTFYKRKALGSCLVIRIQSMAHKWWRRFIIWMILLLAVLKCKTTGSISWHLTTSNSCFHPAKLDYNFCSHVDYRQPCPKATAHALLSRQTPSPPPSDPFCTLTPTLRIPHGQSPYSSDHHICR